MQAGLHLSGRLFAVFWSTASHIQTTAASTLNSNYISANHRQYANTYTMSVLMSTQNQHLNLDSKLLTVPIARTQHAFPQNFSSSKSGVSKCPAEPTLSSSQPGLQQQLQEPCITQSQIRAHRAAVLCCADEAVRGISDAACTCLCHSH